MNLIFINGFDFIADNWNIEIKKEIYFQYY